jgi:hypothetical protein
MKQGEDKTYVIEMSGTQMSVMQEALEFYSRFMLGQVDHIPMSLDWRLKQEHRIHTNQLIDYAISIIKQEMFGLSSRGSNWGIGARTFPTLEEGKELVEPQIAYEMYKMILYKKRQEFFEENPDSDSWTVHDTPPMHYSGLEFIKIKDKKDVE